MHRQLLMIPWRPKRTIPYKDQKVYSVKPIDGSGDLTFSRSNDTATRVDSNGLIEKVRTNTFALELQSWLKFDFKILLLGGKCCELLQQKYVFQTGNKSWIWWLIWVMLGFLESYTCKWYINDFAYTLIYYVKCYQTSSILILEFMQI